MLQDPGCVYNPASASNICELTHTQCIYNLIQIWLQSYKVIVWHYIYGYMA